MNHGVTIFHVIISWKKTVAVHAKFMNNYVVIVILFFHLSKQLQKIRVL